MPLKRTASAVLLSVLALAGCKSKPSTPAPAADSGVAQEPRPAQFLNMTDEQLVRANQSEGLGLGLRITGDHFAPGAPVPFRILVEDLAARVPIASGMCSGASLTYEEVTTHDSRTADIDNANCMGTIPSPDEIPLVKGRLKTAEITQRNVSNMEIPPGTYRMTVNWSALPAGRGTIVERTPYAKLKSNPVEITVSR